jgi:predicted nucleic acid-binding protein
MGRPLMRAFLDSCAIIYAIEGNPLFQAQIIQSLAAVEADPQGVMVVSRLSRMECRVKPMRDGDQATLARYESFFNRSRLQICDISASVLEIATDLRVRYRFKAPDAIHLATAFEQKVDLFVTGDAALQRCTEVPVHVVNP